MVKPDMLFGKRGKSGLVRDVTSSTFQHLPFSMTLEPAFAALFTGPTRILGSCFLSVQL